MNEGPKTPLFLYLLAALVVGGIYWAWLEMRRSSEVLQSGWIEATLDLEEIENQLESEDWEELAHALVQLAQRLRGTEEALPEGYFDRLWPRLETLADRPESTVREYLTPVLAYAPDERALGLLKRMLEDDDKRVALNAAIGLAARGNGDGADLIQDAIAGTRGEQVEQRRSLLLSFRFVASERHRSFLEEELERARLDRDEERIGYCQEALDRLDDRDK